MVRIPTWYPEGTDIRGKKDINEILTFGGLDYNVGLQNVFTTHNGNPQQVNGKSAIVRETDGYVYDIMSSNYTPYQNSEAFAFVDSMSNEIDFLKCGETHSGLVYIIGALPQVDIMGDGFIPHVIFQTSHNGRYPTKMAVCPLRMICQNQFNVAFNDCKNTYTVKHTKNLQIRIKMAQEGLQSVAQFMQVFNKRAEMWASNKGKLSTTQMQMFLDKMFPFKHGLSDTQVEVVEKRKSLFLKAYNSEDNQNFRGSAWGLINALSDYLTHKPIERKNPLASQNRFVKSITDTKELAKPITLINELVGLENLKVA